MHRADRDRRNRQRNQLLVIGSLSQLLGADGGDHKEKIRSFELFRHTWWGQRS